MSEGNMTRHELIKIIGDVLTEIDVLSCHFDPDTDDRKKLDDIRDELDAYQRKLVRAAINENTTEFKKHTASINDINKELRQTINDLDRFATSLETLVKFVGAIQKIAELAP